MDNLKQIGVKMGQGMTLKVAKEAVTQIESGKSVTIICHNGNYEPITDMMEQYVEFDFAEYRKSSEAYYKSKKLKWNALVIKEDTDLNDIRVENDVIIFANPYSKKPKKEILNFVENEMYKGTEIFIFYQQPKDKKEK